MGSKTSMRQIFQENLKAFPLTASLFGESKLKHSFQPNLIIQKTCIVHAFTSIESVWLRYLEEALMELGEKNKFVAKAQRLWNLSIDKGLSEFHSVLIELWFAAQFAKRGLPVICEPRIKGTQRADFEVKVDNTSVYFEVRNLECLEWVMVGISENSRYPRSRLNALEHIIRNAYWSLPYPYYVEIQPYNLRGEEDAFAADISQFLVELGRLLREINEGKAQIPALPLCLPKKNPRVAVVKLVKRPYLKFAWIGWGEFSINELSRLATAAWDKINEKSQQLKPDAANILIIGLPVYILSQKFAEEFLGPLVPTTRELFVASRSKVEEFDEMIQKFASAFVLFQLADRCENYPGWITVVLNPLSQHPLPKRIKEILMNVRGE